MLATGACATSGAQVSRQDYQDRLDDALLEVDRAGEAMSAALAELGRGEGSAERVAERIGDLRDELDRAADGLDDVSPPADVAAAHDSLVDGMRGLADEFDAFRSAIERGDTRAVRAFRESLERSDAAAKLEAATHELRERGYEIQVG